MLSVFRVGIVYKLDVLPLSPSRTLCLDFQRLISQLLHTPVKLHFSTKLHERRPLPLVFPTPKNRIKERSDNDLCNKN